MKVKLLIIVGVLVVLVVLALTQTEVGRSLRTSLPESTSNPLTAVQEINDIASAMERARNISDEEMKRRDEAYKQYWEDLWKWREEYDVLVDQELEDEAVKKEAAKIKAFYDEAEILAKGFDSPIFAGREITRKAALNELLKRWSILAGQIDQWLRDHPADRALSPIRAFNRGWALYLLNSARAHIADITGALKLLGLAEAEAPAQPVLPEDPPEMIPVSTVVPTNTTTTGTGGYF
ncbi:MAG TPA: hypothetical protein VKE92_09790 [Anaerolineales bacterium]|nr:hypothetical protein [Anaerolineales bacterium]